MSRSSRRGLARTGLTSLTGPLLAALALGAPVRSNAGDPARNEAELRSRLSRSAARIVYRTRELAYLDAGALDGIQVGAVLQIARGRRDIGTCAVALVSDHHAACESGLARPGDSVSWPLPAVGRKESPPRPPMPSAEEMERRRAAVQGAELTKVVYAAPEPAAVPARTRAEGTVATAAWTGGTYLQSLDADVRAELAPGSSFALRLTAQSWSGASGLPFRPDQARQLYVWEAFWDARLAASELTLGRFLPRGAPGAPLLDGVQAVRDAGRDLAVGAYAGFVPGPVAIDPTIRRPVAGLQVEGRRAWGGVLFLRGEGRLSVQGSPDRPTRVEAEALASASMKRVDATASLRMAADGEAGGASVDAARLDLTVTPWDTVTVSTGLRLSGSSSGLTSAGSVPYRQRRADADVRWNVAPWIWVGAEASAVRDVDSGLERATFGPTVGLPRLFGRRGGLLAGYLEERGWWPARSGYLQGWLTPGKGWRLGGSIGYSRASRSSLADDDEVWASASAQTELARWLSLRLSLNGRLNAVYTAAEGLQVSGGGFSGVMALAARR